MDKTIEGVDDLFLISIFRVVYFLVLITVTLRRIFPFMIDLITGLRDGTYKIFEQPDASILVILHYLGMLKDDLNDEI